jgi:uncharacterized NAD-dependent epimerase/dehydratase family protein
VNHGDLRDVSVLGILGLGASCGNRTANGRKMDRLKGRGEAARLIASHQTAALDGFAQSRSLGVKMDDSRQKEGTEPHGFLFHEING